MGMQKTVNINVTMFKQLWPYQVMDEIQKVMEEGEAKGKNGWEKQSIEFHVNRAIAHLVFPIDGIGNAGEDHLAHAFCRLMMAVAIGKGYIQREEGK